MLNQYLVIKPHTRATHSWVKVSEEDQFIVRKTIIQEQMVRLECLLMYPTLAAGADRGWGKREVSLGREWLHHHRLIKYLEFKHQIHNGCNRKVFGQEQRMLRAESGQERVQ